jgi:ATP sulfurylase
MRREEALNILRTHKKELAIQYGITHIGINEAIYVSIITTMSAKDECPNCKPYAP